MIVVKLELWPCGSERHKREIGRMYIANDTTSTDPNTGNYDVAVCRRGSTDLPRDFYAGPGPKATRTGRVEEYPRLSYNVWRLILRALRSAFPEER